MLNSIFMSGEGGLGRFGEFRILFQEQNCVNESLLGGGRWWWITQRPGRVRKNAINTWSATINQNSGETYISQARHSDVHYLTLTLFDDDTGVKNAIRFRGIISSLSRQSTSRRWGRGVGGNIVLSLCFFTRAFSWFLWKSFRIIHPRREWLSVFQSHAESSFTLALLLF